MANPNFGALSVRRTTGRKVRIGVASTAMWVIRTEPCTSSTRICHTPSTVTLSSLTLPGPEFAPPRTQRASVGISGAIARATTLHLSATVRHTDFLPRRHDLNLSAAPTTVDRYDRPIYGTLTKQGSMVSVVPGSNRLFPTFDLAQCRRCV